MPKLLLENDWYEPLQHNGIPDTDYETMLLARAPVLFAGFVVAPLRYRVSTARGHSSPHLALVDVGYRSWWLVLLETGAPPSSEYVASQAEILRSARYGRDFSDLAATRSGVLDADSVDNLIKRELPGVFVLLGHPPAPIVQEPSVRIGIAEIFRSGRGAHIIRINGAHPEPAEDKVGTCKRDLHVAPSLLRLTLVPNAPALPTRCEIEIDDAISTWNVRPKGNEYWLMPHGSVTLPVDVSIFALVRGPSGRLRLVPYTG